MKPAIECDSCGGFVRVVHPRVGVSVRDKSSAGTWRTMRVCNACYTAKDERELAKCKDERQLELFKTDGAA